jgi:hypothetical protein
MRIDELSRKLRGDVSSSEEMGKRFSEMSIGTRTLL